MTHAEAAAAVATVYSEPANDVTCPAPLVASVIAWPPLEVTTVANDPPMAIETSDQINWATTKRFLQVTVWKTFPASPVA